MLNEKDKMGNEEQEQQQQQVDESYAVPVPPPDNDGNTNDNNNVEGTEQKPVTMENAKEKIFKNGGYMLLIVIASIVVIISASVRCSDANFCKDKYGFAVASGVISFVFAAAFLALERSENMSPKLRVGALFFFFVWWALTAGLTTFGNTSPFLIPGNGYFAVWGGLVCSVILLSIEVARVHDVIEKFKSIGPRFAILLVGSLVVMFAGVANCDARVNGCSGPDGYAVAVGVISFVLVLGRFLLNSKVGDTAAKYFTLFMIVWWAVATIVLTFFDPFTVVGNGYFGSWACLLSSVMMLNP